MIRKARKKRPVWKHFNSGDRNINSHPYVQCKYCFKDFQRAVPERMQAHLDKCPGAPNNAKSQSKQQNTASTIDHVNYINEKMVRKKAPIWENFNVIGKSEDSHPHVQCKYCFKEFKRAVPHRMKLHIDEKCSKASNNANLQSRQQTIAPTTNNFSDHISEDEQQSLEILLVKALSSAAIPFSFVDNPMLFNFLSTSDHHLSYQMEKK
jgi:hypothetical protein